MAISQSGSLMKRSILVAALMTTSQAALAQQRPDAGQQMLQIPQLPVLQQHSPGLEVQGPATAAPSGADDGSKVQVDHLRLTGSTLFSELELIAATSFVPGRQLNLSDLRSITAQITHFYNRHGYFLAQAYLPAQDISGNALTIAVIEGRYDGIAINNQAALSSGSARLALAASPAATSSPRARSSGACCCCPTFPASRSNRR